MENLIVYAFFIEIFYLLILGNIYYEINLIKGNKTFSREYTKSYSFID
jgi:hypothetical protein